MLTRNVQEIVEQTLQPSHVSLWLSALALAKGTDESIQEEQRDSAVTSAPAWEDQGEAPQELYLRVPESNRQGKKRRNRAGNIDVLVNSAGAMAAFGSAIPSSRCLLTGKHIKKRCRNATPATLLPGDVENRSYTLEVHMKHEYQQRFTGAASVLFSLVCLFCLICLLAACEQGSSPGPTPTVGTTATAQGPGQVTPTPAPNKTTPVTSTSPIASTQTDCPATDTARAMTTATLTPGTHQTIVYIVNEGPFASPTLAILRRYDTVTGVKTDIASLPDVSLSRAQLSPDGQWILFTATDKLGSIKLQVVRLDGQGLQTLYCTTKPGLNSLQWSPTQKFLAFTSGGPGNTEMSVYLLDVATGALQVETSFAGNEPTLVVRTWPDNTRIYLTDTPLNGHFLKLYLLDTNKGANQPLNILAIVAQGTFNDFDSAPDGSQLFINAGGCLGGSCPSPSTITAMPITGGTGHTIFTSSTQSVVQVRSIGGGKLLWIVNWSPSGGNGLWIMNTDGTNMRHLDTSDALLTVRLNLDAIPRF
ncbi:MAG: TolB family protein [Ktedonobacteraceae bacterium]